jgi:hypothetical protein
MSACRWMGCWCYLYAAGSVAVVGRMGASPVPVRCLTTQLNTADLGNVARHSGALVTVRLLMQILTVCMCRRPGRSKQRKLYSYVYSYSWAIRARSRKHSMFWMKLSVACYIGDTDQAARIASAKYLSAYLFLPSMASIYATLGAARMGQSASAALQREPK